MKGKLALPLALMLVFALSRIPGMMPQNFSAAYALAFCGGIYFPGLMAWWLPLGTLLVTDFLLNVFYYHQPFIDGYMLTKTLAFVAIVWLGRRHSPRMHFLRLVCGGLLGAVLFYLITNTASWIYNPEYPKSLAGWVQALTSGIPGYPPTWAFFRNTLLSGGLFTGLFAGAMKFTEAMEPTPEPERAQEPQEEPAGGETPEEAKA